MHYNVVFNRRYYYATLRVQEESRNQSKKIKNEKFKALGLLNKLLLLMQITLALDITITRPSDVAHSEFKSIARQLLNLFFKEILKTKFHKAFALQIAAIPTLPSWPCIQNIYKYFSLFFMQEYSKAILILLIILCKQL